LEEAFYIGISPVIIHLGPISITWYGLMVALAIVAVVGWLAWENKRDHRLSYDTVYTVALVGIPSGIIFSKLMHVIDFFPYYRENPARILSGEGLSIWGAVIGATIGVWIYSLISRHFRFTTLADMIAPGIILSQAIGRVGCTINGCCYGLESHSSLAIIYTNPNGYGPLGIPVLPTTVFEIVYNLIVFGILFSLRKKLKPEGAVFIIYFALYAAWRFGIDFVRDGTPFLKNIHVLANVPFLSDLHEAQVIGLIILLITIPLIVLKVRWSGKSEPVETESKVPEYKSEL
jgi:phosphatidylglycerol---prolipoprotein diacylglyceryl transferase